METRNPNQTKARLIVIVVFVMGLAIGALSMNLYQRATTAGSDTSRGRNDRPPQERILQEMTERLKLSDNQQTQIKSILDNTFGQYRSIRQEMEPKLKEFDPRFESARMKGREEIRKVLSHEQLPEFEAMVQELDLRRQQEAERRREFNRSEPKKDESK